MSVVEPSDEVVRLMTERSILAISKLLNIRAERLTEHEDSLARLLLEAWGEGRAEGRKDGLEATLALQKLARTEPDRSDWGLDHKGEPMRHPPAGDCYCKVPDSSGRGFTCSGLEDVPEFVTYALVYLLVRVGSWTSSRFDQHLRHQLGDDLTDQVLAWLGEHVSGRLGKGEDGVPRYVHEGPVSTRKDLTGPVGVESGAVFPSPVAAIEERLGRLEAEIRLLKSRLTAHVAGRDEKEAET